MQQAKYYKMIIHTTDLKDNVPPHFWVLGPEGEGWTWVL